MARPIAYRDATFSRQTRDELDRIRRVLQGEIAASHEDVYAFVEALEDVVARWDQNEPTEIYIDPAETDRKAG